MLYTPTKQQIAAIAINSVFCTAVCTTCPAIPASISKEEVLQSKVKVPGNTTKPARRIQVKKKASMLYSIEILLDSLYILL